MRKRIISAGLAVAALACGAQAATAGNVPGGFTFENVDSLETMQSLLRQGMPAGTSRDGMRRLFVSQGGATLLRHPDHPNVEKYLYDINLCGYYIWRWNISADYDGKGRTTQLYVNGDAVYPVRTDDPLTYLDETGKRAGENKPDAKTAIFRVTRPRPEANLGESSLTFIVADEDENPETTDDQFATGAGPSRPDPIDMGNMHAYTTPVWRSIFDFDDAESIKPWRGDCEKAHAFHKQNSGP